uniref:Uncharacterized protein n=1 Tax=Meloidogyne enterolobii TaxID=390850 RepID=A0A6V7W244_MELEN|nr:unnamed protein product [Meloidogyne enterolobii]
MFNFLLILFILLYSHPIQHLINGMDGGKQIYESPNLQNCPPPSPLYEPNSKFPKMKFSLTELSLLTRILSATNPNLLKFNYQLDLFDILIQKCKTNVLNKLENQQLVNSQIIDKKLNEVLKNILAK